MDPSAAAEPELAPARTTDNEAQGDDDDDSIAELLDNLYGNNQPAMNQYMDIDGLEDCLRNLDARSNSELTVRFLCT